MSSPESPVGTVSVQGGGDAPYFVIWTDATRATRAAGPFTIAAAKVLADGLARNMEENSKARGYRTRREAVP